MAETTQNTLYNKDGKLTVNNNGQESSIFNWAIEVTGKEGFTSIDLYKEIWTALLGPETGFESFYKSCTDLDNMQYNNGKVTYNGENESFKVNGTTFQTKLCTLLTQKLKDQNPTEAANIVDEKGSLKAAYIKSAAEAALQKLPSNASDLAKIYLSQMAVDGYFPYDTVTSAGLAVSSGKHLQMGCGEGKTGVLVFGAAQQAMSGKQVFLTSSIEPLAKDTMEDTVLKYAKLGLTSSGKEEVVLISQKKITYPKRDEQGNIIVKEKNKPEFIEIDATPNNLREAYSKSIIIADNATIMQHQMQGFITEAKTPDGRTKERVLFADEADYVLLDQYRPSQLLGQEYSDSIQKSRNSYRYLAKDIITQFIKDHPNGFNMDDSNQYVDFTPEGRQIIQGQINDLAAKIKETQKIDIDKQFLSNVIYEALVVHTVYKENRDYQIVLDTDGNPLEIASEDRASGGKIELPQGIAQALCIKEGLRTITSERQVLSATNITQVYNNLFGASQQYISGTLTTSHSEKQRDELNLTDESTYDCSPKDFNSRQLNPKQLFTSQDAQRKHLIDTAIAERGEAVSDGKSDNCYRPVLVGCVSDAEVNAVIESLEQGIPGNPRIVRYTADSERELETDKKSLTDAEFIDKYGLDKTNPSMKSFQKYIKTYCGKSNSNCIIVGTSIIGRGTTITLGDKDVDKENLYLTVDLGGIHVIINGLHETSSRNQIQYAARTARGQDPGSVDEFMSLEDFSPEFLADHGITYDPQTNTWSGIEVDQNGLIISGQELVNKLYDDFYLMVDDRQSNVRTHNNNLMSELQAFRDSLQNTLSKTLTEKGLSPQEIQKRIIIASAFLTERSFNILNRACGNSMTEKNEEYKAEMNAFAAMYVTQFSMENPQEFDIENFFAENPELKDIQDTYFDFSLNKQVEIISSNSGLTEQQVLELISAAGITRGDVSNAWEQTANALQAYRENSQGFELN